MTRLATSSIPSKASKKQSLTKAVVESLSAPGYVYDAKQRGLVLTVGATGRKTWSVYVWDRIKRKPYSKNIRASARTRR